MCAESAEKVCCVYNSKKQVIILLYEGNIDEASIKAEVSKHVPEYMVPGKIIKLDKMPMNANGKTDRKLIKETYCE